jgi:hypothetical protein
VTDVHPTRTPTVAIALGTAMISAAVGKQGVGFDIFQA